mmetsp:Transcript_2129/g.3660  ORF Transcript_2129/g.3660 Transcript_2129/m.3660 type:complete len:158 (+) Transcript_2129:49-522(+)
MVNKCLVSIKKMTSNDTKAASTDGNAPPLLFLRVQYEVPDLDGGDNSAAEDKQAQTQATITNKQSFDASNCPAATIGLPPSVEPVKPDPGDYSFSGMHDHGPLPPPREGGKFAQIVGFVNAAKKASDKYLTEVIEKEKAHSQPATSESNQQHKRKRK